MHDDAMACELQNLHAWSRSSIKAAIMGIRPFFAPNMDIVDKRGITPDSIRLSSFFAGFYLSEKVIGLTEKVMDCRRAPRFSL